MDSLSASRIDSPFKRGLSPAKSKMNNSGVINESSDIGGVLKNKSPVKGTGSFKGSDLKKLDTKSVRMAGDILERKSAKSGKSKTGTETDPYEGKTVEEIELEMDKARDGMERNMERINKLKGNALMSKGARDKEVKPLMEEYKRL